MNSNNQLWVCKTEQITSIVQNRPFIALPQEEIDRHFAAIEMFPLAHNEKIPAAHKLLKIYTVFHHNYSWLTYQHDSNNPAVCFLGYEDVLAGNQIEDLFLDESWVQVAHSSVTQVFKFPAHPEIRLAGLINDDTLGIVFVSRLRQPGAQTNNSHVKNISFKGIGDLQQNPHIYDRWSQIIINNLQAL